MTDLVISPAELADAGEILTLQRASYVSEAQLYRDSFLPALTQTLQELRTELEQGFALKAVSNGGRILGAVRARREGTVWHIGRLIVAPDVQGHGIGSRLLGAVERQAPLGIVRFALFTGHLSVANIRLYQRLGYRESRREPLTAGVELVHLDKPARL